MFFLIKKIFGPVHLAILIAMITFAVGLAYLIQTNTAATQGYKIKELEQTFSQLKEENKKLNLQYIGLQSMANIIGRSSHLNLVATNKVEVITPLGSTVALK